MKEEGIREKGQGTRMLRVKLTPREIEAEIFAQRAMIAFLEGWDMHKEGRSLFYSPAGYSGARLASWRAGWYAARYEQEAEALAGDTEAGEDERPSAA